MRLTALLSRVPTAGIFILTTSVASVMAGMGSEAPVPVSERVFFDRGFPSVEPPSARASAAPALVALTEGRRRERPIVFASLGARASVVESDAEELQWAPTPAVPRLLSKPGNDHAAPPARLPVLEDPVTKALEAEIARRRSRPLLHAHALEPQKPLSEPRRLRMSRASRARMSARWSDPLASVEIVEADSGREPPEFIMPFANGRVTSLFNQGRHHPAIDLAGRLGSPVLITTASQTVVFAGWRGGYGNAVITIDVYGRTHLYGHLSGIASKVGQRMRQGETLGYLGSTGHSTGPHVHYEVRDRKGNHINPVTLLFPGRTVAKGYAWKDPGPLQSTVQLASLAQRDVASDAGPAAAQPQQRLKRKAAPKQKKWRRVREDEDE
jgi:murein DD-endopeptidase MepM/ murein hydrolase activator NlpD